MEDLNMKDETEQSNTTSNLTSKNDMLNNLEGPNLTFQIHEEDHTLGNALRHLAMLNPNTTFAGYAIPHPSISTMNLRIETISNLEVGDKNYILDLKAAPSLSLDKKSNSKKQNDKVGATQVLLKACDDLNLICDKIVDKFNKAVDNYLKCN